MKWTGKTKKSSAFLEAMLPNCFIAAMEEKLPKEHILAQLEKFFIEAEKEAALRENRAADVSPPHPDYVEAMYASYMEIWQEIR